MKFGKLLDLHGVDFTLPEDPPRTARVLAQSGLNAAQSPQIYLGATGWSNKEWLGSWYPKGTKAAEFLQHYSRLFDTIEFNTTHYRIPDADLVARWYQQAAPNFKFCPKIPQQISHRARLNAEDATTRFVGAIAGMQEKLGPTFLQLPDTHGPTAVASVLRYIAQWPQEMPLHFEFRHPDWFSNADSQAETAFDALEASGQGTVITDVAGRRDVLHMELTSPVLVLRFVGNGLHPSDYTRTDAWVQRIQQWCAAGLREAYLFIHQPSMDIVPEFSTYWASALTQATGVPVLEPQIPLPGGQQSLF